MPCPAARPGGFVVGRARERADLVSESGSSRSKPSRSEGDVVMGSLSRSFEGEVGWWRRRCVGWRTWLVLLSGLLGAASSSAARNPDGIDSARIWVTARRTGGGGGGGDAVGDGLAGVFQAGWWRRCCCILALGFGLGRVWAWALALGPCYFCLSFMLYCFLL
ncbi:hypothetical protein RchiOBHm_Chr2g0113141 [Rosa chinensis]|uniref:Uncharacterized protein n=1 Tax=Rosa chinensis TaxID=74649 RepID=A0A2P6RQH0_ROSCH|nr:hypothetical protein RchiOBHm_Chr2g0113141 [Rosa chinensis]